MQVSRPGTVPRRLAAHDIMAREQQGRFEKPVVPRCSHGTEALQSGDSRLGRHDDSSLSAFRTTPRKTVGFPKIVRLLRLASPTKHEKVQCHRRLRPIRVHVQRRKPGALYRSEEKEDGNRFVNE